MATIERLCNDNLVEVFSSLNCKDLKSAMLVCQNFNNVIGSSPSTMKQFCLRLFGWKKSLFVDDFFTTRKHQNIEILDVDDDFDMLERCDVSQVKSLRFLNNQSDVSTLKLMKLLESMELLEILELKCTTYTNMSDVHGINMGSLKTLSIGSNDCQLLRYINAEKLVNIDVGRLRYIWHPTFTEDLADFLVKCKYLKELHINSTVFNQIFTMNNQRKFPFTLEKFIMIRGCYRDSVEDVEIGDNFHHFLITQAATLTVLQLGLRQCKFTQKVMITICNKLERLKTLSINGSLPDAHKYVDQLESNRSLTELIINHHLPTEKAVDGLLRNLPNVRTMKMKHAETKLLHQIANAIFQLVEMTIYDLKKVDMIGFQFRQLKSLKIRDCNDFNHLISLIDACPVLETFHHGSINFYYTKDHLDRLLHNTSLRHLKFWGRKAGLEFIFDRIKTNFGQWKTLELSFVNRFFAGNSIRFEFPPFAEWNVQEQEILFKKLFIVNNFKYPPFFLLNDLDDISLYSN